VKHEVEDYEFDFRKKHLKKGKEDDTTIRTKD